MSREPHILITGSTGNLGEKAIDALAGTGCRITRIGRNSNQRPDVVPADLTTYDKSWAKHFENVDTVLHLAADPKPIATWESVQRLNIDLSLNVLRASQEAGVKRFIFASSNWILGGYRFSNTPLQTETPPKPINPYGASKLFLEQVGLALSNQCGMAFVSLRIGYCAPGANEPGQHMAFGRWGQEMWLSNEDWAQAVQKVCLGAVKESAVLNIMSNNSGMRWDLSHSRAVIGFDPLSKHDPNLSMSGRIQEFLARLRDRVIPQMSEVPAFGRRW